MSDRCPHGDTAAAYLLGALSESETRQFEVHLVSCASCPCDVAALRLAVGALPVTATPVLPPLELRDRLMVTVRSEAELLHAAGPSADRPRRARPRFGIGLQRPLALAGAAAIALAAIAGFGVRALTEGNPAAPTRTIRAGVASRVVQARVDTAAAPHGSARVVLRAGVATLQVSHMPSPPPGHVYEVWLTRPGVAAPAPTDALFSVDRHGSGRVALPSVTGVQAVLVTAEPDGGSSSPTRQPVISAAL